MIDLNGLNIIVTGGAQGIGASTAMFLAENGANIAICDINISSMDELKSNIEKLGRKCIAYQVDVSNGESVKSAFEKVINDFGTIDVLVNNAGITRDTSFLRMREEDWDRVMNINLKGVFLCTKSIIQHMMKNRKGKIINISSIVGMIGNPGQANYAASKAGIIGFSRAIAKEFAGRNITVNIISPGYIDTPMTHIIPEEAKKAFLARVPLNRPGLPLDVAKGVAFFASPLSDYVTGHVLMVDGGMILSK